ncbi:MAG: ribosome-associated translation inhibitor RaiA [Firmicutes bacterium]|nr:ribosome-associated translation inhibitor RaiA [Bacillota bacterium]
MAVEEVRVVVKGKNLEVTPALREYAHKKLKKVAKFFDEPHEPQAEVVLKIERELQMAEITVQVGGLLVRGEGRTPDMYASLDEAIDRIERQIRKYKTKFQKRQQGPGLGELASSGSLGDITATEEEEVAPPRVVKTKRFAMKPMSVEEAILQMELLGHDFFVFANAATDEVNVVYKRRNGDYGLIEPEF